MKTVKFNPKGVCCREMIFVVDENNVMKDIQFIGGCAGNMLGIKAIVEGMDIKEVAEKLEGIPCGKKTTSCPDQLSKAIKEII